MTNHTKENQPQDPQVQQLLNELGMTKALSFDVFMQKEETISKLSRERDGLAGLLKEIGEMVGVTDDTLFKPGHLASMLHAKLSQLKEDISK